MSRDCAGDGSSVCEKIAVERLWGIPGAAEIWFLRVMKILDRLIGLLRGCCHSLPDLRQGGGTRYTMADMSAFSLFFLQSPSFLAHQRRLEEGQGRSNCQTLFGLDRIPSDNHIRALLDPVSPDHFHPVFAEVVTELERSGGLKDFRRLGDHVLIALDGTEITCRTRCIVSTARPASGARTGPSTSTRWCRRRSWHPSTTGWCRWSRSSSCRRMVTTSRTAKAGRFGAGWSVTGGATPG